MGTDYLKRPVVAPSAWPANLPQGCRLTRHRKSTASGPNLSSRNPLHLITFAKGLTPAPITRGLLVDHYVSIDQAVWVRSLTPLNSSTVSAATIPKYKSGTVADAFTFQTNPGQGSPATNWLPAPKAIFPAPHVLRMLLARMRTTHRRQRHRGKPASHHAGFNFTKPISGSYVLHRQFRPRRFRSEQPVLRRPPSRLPNSFLDP